MDQLLPRAELSFYDQSRIEEQVLGTAFEKITIEFSVEYMEKWKGSEWMKLAMKDERTVWEGDVSLGGKVVKIAVHDAFCIECSSVGGATYVAPKYILISEEEATQ